MRVDLRLAIPAAAGWVAAAIVVGVPFAATPALVLAWIAAGVLVLVRPRVALAAAAVALCCTSIALQAPARHPQVLMDAASQHRTVTAVATTTQTAFPGRGSFEVRFESVAQTVVSVPVLVYGDGLAERLGIGTRITLAGYVVATEAGDDRAFIIFPDDPPTVIESPPWYLDWANELRAGFLRATQELPGDGGDLLAGLAIGDTSAVSDDLDSAMKSSSLSHLTAVSGANCAIVIGLMMLAGAALGLPRWLRIGVSIATLIGFVVLVTPEPSVLRAALMAALVLLALSGGRPVQGLPILSLATMSLLVLDPWLARNYGFVLSVLATAGLLLLAGPLAGVLGRWLPRWLALVIAVPVAAQLACQPVIVLLNASLPAYGVVANILAAPAAPIATVVGLAACVLLALVPPLGTLLCLLAWVPSFWIAAVASFFAGAPGAQLPWPAGAGGVALLVAVSALAVGAVVGSRRWRRWAAAALILIMVGYVGVAAGGRIGQQLGRPAEWQIAGCDVGQGDAFVVRSAGVVALIDTGPDEQLLAACLADLGIDRIDLLVLTHYDHDHVGGVSAVLGRVDRALVGPVGRPGDDDIVADLRAAGADVQQVARGPSGMLGELRWHVLWPPVRLAGIEPGNSASVTVEFEPVGDCLAGCFSSIFLGDLGESAQDRLLAANPLGEVDVVKVSHHGSADQSVRMYERLHAVVGLIGVGADNGYGHPTEKLLDLLTSTDTAAVRTDNAGLILLLPGGEGGAVTVWTER
ncbi:ComEC/Rec2 family competence protein [Salinibacterium sp. G-O1]|uniref:ComEC/Rec2 family competence protein n=1 Tax=Salinibacterium sp. G-O1 TaxID=3046208 RepID=UPI0024BA8CB3|nr:ComEC/Rec2 family competence protein [Salinibacterium sp. G-O1]MDJ0335442.1 ComEC/Rec2 family competence protein [Salinibacterium sp. G-O1]